MSFGKNNKQRGTRLHGSPSLWLMQAHEEEDFPEWFHKWLWLSFHMEGDGQQQTMQLYYNNKTMVVVAQLEHSCLADFINGVVGLNSAAGSYFPGNVCFCKKTSASIRGSKTSNQWNCMNICLICVITVDFPTNSCVGCKPR